MTRLGSIFLALGIASTAQAGDPISILFVGNSYTFGRVDPVMSYNTFNSASNPGGVHDLTSPDRGGSFINTSGSNPYEPHNWGGVPGIFKKFTDQAGLSYDVSISARNAASLRGHYLNTSPSGWDLQSNLAYKKWDKVVLQDLSDEPLPAGRSGNANKALFSFYANKIADYIRTGIQAGVDATDFVLNTTESLLWGGPTTGTNAQRAANCIAGSGLTQGSCNTARTIKGNPNENAAAQIYLYQTWARPDMVFTHGNTTTDPITGAVLPASGTSSPTYTSLQAMTTDLHTSYFELASANPSRFNGGVAPVGDAFMRAVQDGVATANPYAAAALTDGLIDLWWDDNLHASKYGSYLSALTMFGQITGLDPQSLGINELAASELGISGRDAYSLQQIAAQQLGFARLNVPEPGTLSLALAALLGAAGLRRKRATNQA